MLNYVIISALSLATPTVVFALNLVFFFLPMFIFVYAHILFMSAFTNMYRLIVVFPPLQF